MKINPSSKLNKDITDTSQPWLPIIGNPNCGKTALFNRLTGLHHKIGNYPGITVEKKSGWLRGHDILIKDYPGTYSLNAKSIDEKIVSDMVQGWRDKKNRPNGVIVILDSTNITKNIYLALQILDWQIPTIIVLNMIDEAEKNGIQINVKQLKKHLNTAYVIPASAKTGHGIQDVFNAIIKIAESELRVDSQSHLLTIEELSRPLSEITKFLQQRFDKIGHLPEVDSMRLISESNYIRNIVKYLEPSEVEQLKNIINNTRNKFAETQIPYQTIEQTSRFAYIDLYIANLVKVKKTDDKSPSEKIDNFLTHKFFGPAILIGVLFFIFNAIFSWAQWPMEQISIGVNWLSTQFENLIPDGIIQSMVVDGILAGVGSILVFLPQILLLVFFLSILEDSGYMARMAFMMDRLMHKIGLHGRSVLPLLSGFACAIPAIMSARTIENWRDRIQTILMIPLMSCSARLPVYVILIAAFIPDKTVLGFLSLQALVLMGMYFLGMFTAVIISIIIKKIKKRNVEHSLIMELPPYRRPMFSSIGWQVYERGKIFLLNAGTIILAISIVLWFLASFPKPDDAENLSPRQKIEQSYAGKIGHAIEPIIKPLGYDWKIGVGLITSFAAREVIISTLSTLYNLEENEHHRVSLIDAMRNDRYANGKPVFSILVAVSLMVFFAYAAQCMATFAIIKRETNSWRWPVLMVIYMTILAYSASLFVYQGGQLLGFN
ncbi:MAG: ferrous iron transport protein B [Calditrichaceae bacterium]|nr:ferrous iron transport protein B [Calditrichaceae bacterium]